MFRSRFKDRIDAGRKLAAALSQYAGRNDVLVLALPRGGVPVGAEIARELHVPLDVFVVRKLGVPDQPELAMGAIAAGGTRVINYSVADAIGITPGELDRVAQEELRELNRRQELYRDGRKAPEVMGKIVILVDDGLATGSTMRAAVLALRQMHPAKIVVAVPVASPDVVQQFTHEVDEMICLLQPEYFAAVGLWYEDFSQTTDEEVRELLRLSPAQPAGVDPWMQSPESPMPPPT